MKGSNKKKVSKKKTFKSGGKGVKRAHLHSGNHQYNAWMKSHTVQTGLDGTPQGKHDPKNKGTCRCGGCSNKDLTV